MAPNTSWSFVVGAGAGDLGEAALAALPSVERVSHDDNRWRLTVREVHRAVPALLAALTEAGAEPTHLTTHHATLEEAASGSATRLAQPSRSLRPVNATNTLNNRLLAAPGVAAVERLGGYLRQFQVQLDPERTTGRPGQPDGCHRHRRARSEPGFFMGSWP